MAYRAIEIEVYFVYHASIKQQKAGALSLLSTKYEGHAIIHEKVLVLTVSLTFLECAQPTEVPDFEFIEDPEGPFMPFT